MKKIIVMIILTLIVNISLISVNALNIYENYGYSVYFNNIKSNVEYKVAKVGEGDRVFYDLDGIKHILTSKGGTNTNIYKLGEDVQASISKISSELGETIENNDIQTLVDYTGIKENDNIAITTKLNNNLLYGITNKIGTKEFIPFAIIKYDIYGGEKTTYETIIFSKVDIGSDVESYIDSGKVYYPIRFISLLLGGEINLFKSDETGRDTTGISVNFDIKENYEYEKIFSNEDDEKNNVLSKNQCMSVKVKKEGKEVKGRIYNLDSDTLALVQNNNLDKFISDEKDLEKFKNNTDTISICNTKKEIDVDEIEFDIFVGTENQSFIPTNLTIQKGELVIKNTEGVILKLNNILGKTTIKNIEFQKPSEIPLTFDKTFDINTKEYQTKETLSNSVENIYYTIEYENGETSDGYVYLEPNKEYTSIIINDYTFNIKRSIKDFNTNLKSIKYKKTSDTEWIDLAINAEGKYTIENALYSDYELLVEPSRTTSTVTSTTGEISKDGEKHILIPKTATQTFNVVAEDGTTTEYSVNFNYPDTETIELIGIYQGSNTLTVEQNEENKYIIREFDRTQGETVNIKYKVLPSKEEKETGEFKPSDLKDNTNIIYLGDTTYLFEFIEKEGVVVGPLSCVGATVISTGTINDDNVSVRTTPDTSVDTNIIQEFSTGQKLQIIKPEEDPKKNDNWHLVVFDTTDNKCGYVYKEYVQLDSENNTELNNDFNGSSNTIFSQYNEQASEKLKNMTLNEKIGQLLLVGIPSSNQISAIQNYHFGGYILFQSNFTGKTKAQVQSMINSYQNASKIPMLIAVDEEGGTVTRISKNTNLVSTPFKSPRDLYNSGGLDAIKNDTINKSNILADLGINLNLAPVVDISTNSNDFIYKRSLGQSTEITSNFAKLVIETSKSNIVSYTLKHFPGYGNNADTHTGMATDNRTLSAIKERDIPPFKAGIDAGAEAIMVSHNVITSVEQNVSASLSSKVISILRNDLNFTGVIMTDDLTMGGTKSNSSTSKYVKALLAGNDLLLVQDYTTAINDIKNAINSGIINENLINERVHKILSWKYYKYLL